MRPPAPLPTVLALTVMALAGCGDTSMGPYGGSGSPSPQTDVAIAQGASTLGTAAFSPNPFSASFATHPTIVWFNGDQGSGGLYGSAGTTHHLVSDIGLFDSGLMGPGSSYSFTFGAAGSFAYHCSIHPTMKGTITLTP